jgi:protein EFR3
MIMRLEIGMFKFNHISNSSAERNTARTRLIGLAALTGAIMSEALYNDAAQFKYQVSAMMRPLLVTILQADLSTLNQQSVL